jgi:hypothetical protein
MRMNRLVRTLLSVVVVLSPTTTVLAQSSSGADGCFVKEYPRAENTNDLARIEVAVRKPADPRSRRFFGFKDDGESSAIEVRYRFWSIPNAEFSIDDFRCPRAKNGKITCSVDCNGAVSFSPLINGDLLVVSDRIGTDSGSVSSLVLTDDADAFSLLGVHVLRRVNPELCHEVARPNGGGIVLQRGDYHPYVRQISTQLAKLGFWTTPGTSLFTEELSNAIRDFQTKFQLEPTGSADTATIRTLDIQAVTGGSC